MDVSESEIERMIHYSGFIIESHWDNKEMFMDDHHLTDASAKFFHLFPCIAKKGIAGPSSKQHDGEYWDIS
jgi:hypothetical protein